MLVLISVIVDIQTFIYNYIRTNGVVAAQAARHSLALSILIVFGFFIATSVVSAFVVVCTLCHKIQFQIIKIILDVTTPFHLHFTQTNAFAGEQFVDAAFPSEFNRKVFDLDSQLMKSKIC